MSLKTQICQKQLITGFYHVSHAWILQCKICFTFTWQSSLGKRDLTFFFFTVMSALCWCACGESALNSTPPSLSGRPGCPSPLSPPESSLCHCDTPLMANHERSQTVFLADLIELCVFCLVNSFISAWPLIPLGFYIRFRMMNLHFVSLWGDFDCVFAYVGCSMLSILFICVTVLFPWSDLLGKKETVNLKGTSCQNKSNGTPSMQPAEQALTPISSCHHEMSSTYDRWGVSCMDLGQDKSYWSFLYCIFFQNSCKEFYFQRVKQQQQGKSNQEAKGWL